MMNTATPSPSLPLRKGQGEGGGEGPGNLRAGCTIPSLSSKILPSMGSSEDDKEGFMRLVHGFLYLLANIMGTTALSYSSGAEEIPARVEKATFAGGCFWCMEEAFEKVKGVVSATSGYTGGSKVDPSYEEVSAG